MTFDPSKPFKIVDNAKINLTPAEISERQAEELAYENRVIPEPQIDPVTQLTNLLVSKGVLNPQEATPVLANIEDGE